MTYCIGFAVIALYWVGHRRTFLVIVRTDGVLTMLNLVLLLFIAFMPFPTAVLGKHGDTSVAVVFYALTQTATGIVALALWLYAAIGHRLISRDISTRLIVRYSLRATTAPIVFLLSTPLAQWNPSAAEYSWGSILVVLLILRRVFGNDL